MISWRICVPVLFRMTTQHTPFSYKCTCVSLWWIPRYFISESTEGEATKISDCIVHRLMTASNSPRSINCERSLTHSKVVKICVYSTNLHKPTFFFYNDLIIKKQIFCKIFFMWGIELTKMWWEFCTNLLWISIVQKNDHAQTARSPNCLHGGKGMPIRVTARWVTSQSSRTWLDKFSFDDIQHCSADPNHSLKKHKCHYAAHHSDFL